MRDDDVVDRNTYGHSFSACGLASARCATALAKPQAEGKTNYRPFALSFRGSVSTTFTGRLPLSSTLTSRSSLEFTFLSCSIMSCRSAAELNACALADGSILGPSPSHWPARVSAWSRRLVTNSRLVFMVQVLSRHFSILHTAFPTHRCRSS